MEGSGTLLRLAKHYKDVGDENLYFFSVAYFMTVSASTLNIVLNG
jgi:hypothetical protein